MNTFSQALLALLAATALSFAAAVDPQVNLGYATYEGLSLSDGVNQFLGMRYAAAPTGQNRFRVAQAPEVETGVVDAKSHGPICLAVQGLSADGSVPLPASEDCLFIDVYAPSNTTSASSNGLPVMLWIQGGGYVELFNPNYNGTGLVEASGHQVIVVSFNYRVGPYGFLASKELQQEDSLNIGLRDQRAAIRWVEDHITKFGGNPDAITLFGTSAGAGDVLLQNLAYGGNPPANDTAQWVAGIASSPYMGPTFEVAEVEYQYSHLLNATNCTDLACLRSLDSTAVQAANTATVFPGQTTLALFPYGPVVDGKLLNDTPSAMLKAGWTSKNRPLAIGSSLTEGTLFAEQANTTSEVLSFLQTQYPYLTSNDFSNLNHYYTNVSSTMPGVTAQESPLYYHLSSMYGDASFLCATIDFGSQLSEAGVSVYMYRDDIRDPAEVEAGYIVPHTWDLLAYWGPEFATAYVALPNATSYNIGGVNHAIVAPVQAYWTSFARTAGNPNSFKATQAPVWQPYSTGQRRLRLQTNSTVMESIPDKEFAKCKAWENVSARTRI